MKRSVFVFGAVAFLALTSLPLTAAESPGPEIDQLVVTPTQKSLRVTPAPGAQAYQFYSATNATGPFTLNTNFVLAPYITGYSINSTNVITNLAYEYRLTNFNGNMGFFTMSATTLPSNTVALATVLNRLAYGPTPDDLVTYSNNPQLYINTQLNMNGIPETMDAYTVQVTNSVLSNPLTNWTQISMTGTLPANLFSLFMTQPGEVVIDDLVINPHIYTNYLSTNVVNNTNVIVTNWVLSHIESTNLLKNGDFESGNLNSWIITNATANSFVEQGGGRLGGNALHLISTNGATTAGNNSLRQNISLSGLLGTTNPCTFSYWYLPSPDSTKLRAQIGNGVNSTPGGMPTTPTWVYGTATGKVDSSGRLYLFLSAAGTVYIDDLNMVVGTVADSGANVLLNSNFETGTTNGWIFSTRYVTNSAISSDTAHSGNYSLKLVGFSGGSASTTTSVYQTNGFVNGQTYTVSFWYLPVTVGANLTVQLSGANLNATPDTDIPGVYRRLESGTAALADYRAWFCRHAVTSERQLFEILSQFLENHFVTQWSKSRDYLTGRGYDGTTADRLAVSWEWAEMSKWRNALLNPNCTFYDLLKISAESPAMIVYLDSVNSTGAGNNVANENYARELLELFCFGVDNGYDQNDIVQMSRAWSGWSVELVDTVNANNPFAAASTTLYPGSNSTSKAFTVGTWAFNFKSGNHGTNRGALFPGKTVPARFGPPWAGGSYQLSIPGRTSTNGILDGYDVIAHMANQPFTQEYISVKLCRLFVHDEFPNPTTIPDSPEYAFYDYTNPNRSAEAELVHQCMLTWENSSPKGNIRAVLSTIFNSELFRSQSGNAQKVKTPLEFVISAVRALRVATNNPAGFTANTDGTAFITPLSRMGGMNLFDRDAPDGYPETAPNWISAGTLVERIRFIQALLLAGTNDDAGNNTCDPVGLFKARLAAGSWTDAAAVTDFFLSILYPAEGAANLQLYREAGISFLNTADNGTSSSPFNTLSGSTLDTRVRGLVSMLMTMQRFQEQ